MDALGEVWISREDYRQWRAEQPRGRFERVDGRIVRMAAERAAHVRVKFNVCLALRNAIWAAALPCEALTDGMTVEVGENDYEPDAVVNCGARLDDDALVASNPVVVVEVLSPSTQGNDTGGKLADYFRIPSITHYLIVHPTKRVVIHHRRTFDGEKIETAIVGSGHIRLDPPGFVLKLDDFYGAETAGL